MKHSYLGMSLVMLLAAECSSIMPFFITNVLKDAKVESVVTPVSGTLFLINESSPPLDEVHRNGDTKL